MNYRKMIGYSGGIVFFSLFIFLHAYGLEKTKRPAKQVTIFIHGTRMMRSFPFSLSTSLKTFDTNISTPLMGLHHYSAIPETNNQVTIAKILHKANPSLFPLETFYLYGWSRQLSLSERRKEAKNLALQIKSLIVEPYKTKYGIIPEITIITHSHGGNLVLNLAREKNLPFSIDTLIMLACPVQHETTKFITSPVFKTIYSLYSHNDILQVLDPQFIGTINHGVIKAFTKKSTTPLKRMWEKLTFPFFSSRLFTKKPSLYQINMAWKQRAQWSELDFAIYGPLHSLGKKMAFFDKTQGRGLTHLEFLIPTFIEKIPAIIAQAQALKSDFTFYLS